MLLIQKITLQWHKTERDAKYATIRKAFPLAYPLIPMPEQNHEMILHHTSYFQNGTKIQNALELTYMQAQQLQATNMDFSAKDIQNFIVRQQKWIQKHTYQYYEHLHDINCKNIHITKDRDAYTITFCEQHCDGMPIYRGHNKDFQNIHSPFYGKNLLNEVAFSLQENQYGRILYQKRFTDVDTGNWYYCLFIYNFLYTNQKMIDKNILVSHKPDTVYTQLGHLF